MASAPGTDALSLDGPGPAVVLFHGYTGSPYELTPLARSLAAAGCAVTVPLLPGHGTTPRDLSSKRWADFLDAAVGAFDRVTASGTKAFVGGLSMGALLALAIASDGSTRARVRGVLSYACALQFPPAVTAFLSVLRVGGGLLPDWYVAKGALDVQDPAVVLASPAYRTRPLRSARELLAGQALVRTGMHSIQAPLLAFHGLRDRTCPFSASVELLRGVGSEDASLVLLPRSGHQVTIDRDRDAVARQSAAFVARLT